MSDTRDLIKYLRNIVGSRHCMTSARSTERYRKGYRSGCGDADAVVRPATLIEFWKVLQACVEHDVIILVQATNTGLTEGSTPKGRYNRRLVIVSTLRINSIYLLDGGRQIVSLPGGTLSSLENLLRPLGRQPHSVIGSSCIGASIVGGVCNNSGGALVKRGPAYTELSVFAQISRDGKLQLINNLGMELGDSPEEILGHLEHGSFMADSAESSIGLASDKGYADRVRDVDASTPARFNADPRGLFDASGSAGKIAVFAVRLDTFPIDSDARVYYVGTNEPQKLGNLRRKLLTELPELPISCEYLHRDCFDIAKLYGKDTLLIIQTLGTRVLPTLFGLKAALDSRLNRMKFLPENLTDKIMQKISELLPESLPTRMLVFRDLFEHHLILNVAGAVAEDTESMLTETVGGDGWFLCDSKEAEKAMLHRFAAAGAGVRYCAVHPDLCEEILPLDVALPRNELQWVQEFPTEVEEKFVAKIHYGHFLCHVFHLDYVVRKGEDISALKENLLRRLRERGAEYPAEHNVGHLYLAKPKLREHYQKLDPTNSFNPGIGGLSREKFYGDNAADYD